MGSESSVLSKCENTILSGREPGNLKFALLVAGRALPAEKAKSAGPAWDDHDSHPRELQYPETRLLGR